MAEKEIKIQIPEGYDDYKIEHTENGCVVKFIKKKLSLDEILSKYEWDDDLSCMCVRYYFPKKSLPNKNVTDVCVKVEAYCELCCVADYLNGGIKVDHYDGYYIKYSQENGCYYVGICDGHLSGMMPLFKTKELALEAIRIMGVNKLNTIFKIW